VSGAGWNGDASGGARRVEASDGPDERARPARAGGTVARPGDTLLVDRARDFLAAGPATAAELVARVCQLPGVGRPWPSAWPASCSAPTRHSPALPDGRWSLAAAAPVHREAGAPVVAAPSPAPLIVAPGHAAAPVEPPAARLPTFAEWQAARAARAAEPGEPEPRARGRRRAVAPPRTLPGDDDLLREPVVRRWSTSRPPAARRSRATASPRSPP
jgi:hypothetical protein